MIDFFMSETARYADLVLPGSLMEEDEGTTTNVEGRVIHHRQVVKPPAGAREDWRIICDLAKRLGAGDKFAYQSTHDIFEELRIASKGGVADYAGITWDRIDREMGVFWPCPVARSPGHAASRTRVALRSSRRQGALSAGRLAPGGGRARRRLPHRADDGARGVAVFVGHADAPDRRASSISIRSRDARSIRGWRRRSASSMATSSASRAGAGGRRPRAGGEDHPAGHRVRALSLAAGPVWRTTARSARSIQSRRFPSSRSARCAYRRRPSRPASVAELEPAAGGIR
mgnify:CR=1 FL=1